MRIPATFRVAVGVAIVLLVGSFSVEAKKAEEKKDELAKPLTNSIQKPSILNMIRRLLPDQKTIDSIRAAVNAKPQPGAKALNVEEGKGRSLKNKNKSAAKETKSKATPTPSSASAKKTVKPAQASSRLRSSITPKTTSSNGKVTPKVSHGKKPTQQATRKLKTGKELKSRQNSKTSFASFNEEKSPEPHEMEILSSSQKQNRLRQELVRETEGNCLAKILCGTNSKPKQKQSQSNPLISDTAYLIREFFNIFDFTIDTVRDEINEIDEVNKKAYEAEEAEKKKQADKQQDDEDGGDDDDDDDDDEEDDVYRKSPVNEQSKKKYTTRVPVVSNTVKTTTSAPSSTPSPTKSKPEPEVQQMKTQRPKPVSNVKLTTVGDMAPHRSPSSNSMDRRGEYVTPSSNLLTSTIMSTSMIGSATLKPMDMLFSIPLKTGKDDDDEDDDNQKYQDEYNDDGTGIHRVTLEELVGDIQLSPSEFDMIRRGRSMRQPRMKIALKNITTDKYIQTKLKQMKLVQNESKKLKIAEKVARSMREPRQCRQFTQVAQEVLQTCPLTTEVIKFFNTNLKNGTSIEVKKTAPGSQTQGGGLVILNNDENGASQQSFFVDNSPKIKTPSKIQSDLKNPSIPTSYNEDEDQYTVYEKRPNPNPQNANLNQFGQDSRRKVFPTTTTTPVPKKKPAKEESEEEQDDDGDSEESEEDDLGRRDDEYEEDDDEAEDDTGSREDEYDDEESGEEDDSDDSTKKQVKDKIRITIQSNKDHQKIQGALTNQPNVKIAVRPQPAKPPSIPTTTLPPGVIRVYGVPTSSFDREFSQLNGQIGKPINLFGDEFIDTPPYKKRRPVVKGSAKYIHRTSKKAKNDDTEDDELENVAFNARVPKHPPLAVDTFVHDGEGDEDDDTKRPYQNPPKKHQSTNGGKPLGGIKGGDDDDDKKKEKDRSSEKRDSSEDKEDKSSEKKDGDDKDNSAEEPPEKIVSIDESPFSPSIMYGIDSPQAQASQHFYGNIGGGSPLQYGSQIAQYHQQQYHHEGMPMRRPHAYRPLVRPIKIMPDVNFPITGVNFRPSRDYMRPGRLYPMYHGKK